MTETGEEVESDEIITARLDISIYGATALHTGRKAVTMPSPAAWSDHLHLLDFMKPQIGSSISMQGQLRGEMVGMVSDAI